MATYRIQPKKVTLNGNELLVTPLSRRAANEFRERMNAAGDDEDASMRVGLDTIAANVKFADGSALDVDEVPTGDLVELLSLVVGGGQRSVADFTGTP